MRVARCCVWFALLCGADDVLAQNVADGFHPERASTLAIGLRPDGKIMTGFDTSYTVARLQSDGSFDFSFAELNLDDAVDDVVAQPDGGVLLAGRFQHVGGYARNRLVRFRPDGSVDPAFDPNVDNEVTSLALQPDGKVIIGGYFQTLAPNGGAAYARNCLARLNADGTVDTSYDPHPGDVVYGLAVQPDGKLLVGGKFTFFSPNGVGNIPRNSVARINADGSVDSSWDPNANGVVDAFAVQPDGYVVLAGAFGALNPRGTGTVPRNRIARVRPDNSSVDPAFDPNANGQVYTLAMQPDGKILLGGQFSNLAPNAGATLARSTIARLNPDGTLDAFNPNAIPIPDCVACALAVRKLIVQPDGRILVAGAFAGFAPNNGAQVTAYDTARLNADGTVDQDLGNGVDGNAYALALQRNGDLVVGGAFTGVVFPGGAMSMRNHIARFLPDGNLDAKFDPDANGDVRAVTVLPDDSLVVGGLFTSFNQGGGQTTRNRIALLLAPYGTLDKNFDPNANGTVNAIARQSDGRLLIGGTFTSLAPNGGAAVTRHRVARLNADGTLDAAFDPNASGEVNSIVVQGDGKIVIGGSFISLAPNGGASAFRLHIARLNADGSLDATYDPQADNTVYALALRPDGSLYAGGAFTQFTPNGGAAVARNYIAHLSAAGAVDTVFDANPNGIVFSIAQETESTLYLGGAFTALAPHGGASVTRNHAAQIFSDGNLIDFDPDTDQAVYAIAEQGDGRIVIGGAFSSVAPAGGAAVARSHLARLNTGFAAIQDLDLRSTGIYWSRISLGEFDMPPELEWSLDGSAYAAIGAMSPIPGGWKYAGFTPPITQNFYLRATGRSGGGYKSGSHGIVDSVRRIYLPSGTVYDRIFVDGFGG